MWLDLQKLSLMAQQFKFNLWLNAKATLYVILSRHTKHMGTDSQVYFHRWLFSSLSNHEGAPQGWNQWMVLIRMCAVPNCSQWLSWPILCIVTACATYWTHTTTVCVFNGGLNPSSVFYPSLPPTPLHMPFVILQSLWKGCS